MPDEVLDGVSEYDVKPDDFEEQEPQAEQKPRSAQSEDA